LRQQGFELAELNLCAVIALDTRRAQNLAYDWIQCTILVVRRAVVDERHVRLRPHALSQRKGEPRLADTQLAGQNDNATLATLDLHPAPQKEIRFLLSPE
jgi:hypothetical protein